MSNFDIIHWIYLTRIKKVPMSQVQKIIPEMANKEMTLNERDFLKECHLARHKEFKYIINKFTNLVFKSVKTLNKSNIHIPNTKGLYLIGNIAFNYNTNKKEYWIKVGHSTNLRSRMNQYYTHNPSFIQLDYYIHKSINGIKVTEKLCHFALNQIAFGRINDEWFLISEQDFLQIQKEKFSWFGL